MHLWGFGVHDLHGIAPAGDVEDGRIVKVVTKFLSVQRCTGYEQFDVWPEAGNVLDLHSPWKGGEVEQRHHIFWGFPEVSRTAFQS